MGLFQGNSVVSSFLAGQQLRRQKEQDQQAALKEQEEREIRKKQLKLAEDIGRARLSKAQAELNAMQSDLHMGALEATARNEFPGARQQEGGGATFIDPTTGEEVQVSPERLGQLREMLLRRDARLEEQFRQQESDKAAVLAQVLRNTGASARQTQQQKFTTSRDALQHARNVELFNLGADLKKDIANKQIAGRAALAKIGAGADLTPTEQRDSIDLWIDQAIVGTLDPKTVPSALRRIVNAGVRSKLRSQGIEGGTWIQPKQAAKLEGFIQLPNVINQLASILQEHRELFPEGQTEANIKRISKALRGTLGLPSEAEDRIEKITQGNAAFTAILQGEVGRKTEGDIARAINAMVTVGSTSALAQEMLENMFTRLESARGFFMRGVPEDQIKLAFPGLLIQRAPEQSFEEPSGERSLDEDLERFGRQ